MKRINFIWIVTKKKAFGLLFVCNLAIFCDTVFGDINSGLAAYYNFESMACINGEIVVDQSGNGHNGTCRQNLTTAKAPSIVPGPSGLGDALYFDGDFYVEVPNHDAFNITQGITIALWFRVDQFNTDWQTMFCRGDWSWRAARNGSANSASFHLSGFGSIYGSWGKININDGQWHHIAGVWQGSGYSTQLWIDGVRDDAQDEILSGSINTSGSDPVTIGAQINEGILRRQWVGCLDDVRLYSRALSESEVQELYLFSFEQGWNSIPSVKLPAAKFLSLEDESMELALEGQISDDGFPLPANISAPDPEDPYKLRWWWEVISWPSEANEPVLESIDSNDIAGSAFVYNNPGQIIIVNPNVKLVKTGYYEFRLYVSDGEKTNHANMGIALYPAGISSSEYRRKGYLYLSPLPGAEYESSQTKYLLFRFVEVSPSDINNLSSFITVTGQKSGYHSGTTRIASDKKTVVFEVASTFSNNELVTVALDPIADPNSGTIEPYDYQFMTSGSLVLGTRLDSDEEVLSSGSPLLQTQMLSSANGPVIMPNGVSVPGNFPQIKITVNDNPDSGYIFLDNRTTGNNSYNIIFDNTGSPVWYCQTNDERRDMKVQPNGVLTMLARDGYMRFIGLDTHYKQIAEYRAVNGCSTDEHELVVLENGYYFLFGLRSETVDMRKYVSGGNSSAYVDQTMIQEFTPEGDLIFQWRAWDHFDVRDVHLDNNRSSSFRFPHMNAIDFDDDGQILLSSRHISEITKIDKNTGEIIWRLGGNHSDFVFVNDPLNGFRNQHTIRAIGKRRYLLFDNGDLHNPPVSRAVEYELDHNDMTATLVWEYRETPDIYSHYMGNTQRLTNGNTLINWAIGSAPKLMEVRPDGTKAFEMNWVSGYEAYRVWRCRWQGMSPEPVLDFEQKQYDAITLIFNKFGDPNVDYYRIYGGKNSEPTTLMAVSDSTLAYISDFDSSGKYYFRVTAVDVNGTESGYSNEESVNITVSGTGTNIVQNGDFSQGINNWIWETPVAPASGTWEIKNGQFHYIIDDGGTVWSSIQLRQDGIILIQGRNYVFEFDAWADSPRTIEAKVGQDVSPWTNYSKIGTTYITTQKKHCTYSFTMDNAADYNARVVINTGTSDIDVYIDNISLKYAPVQ
ncbi:MAG: aryl-sulfate sulfotransferase [Sedimentisphaerales bacterium]|nr:aryl-sulfate sulfotransferase [Sedimentisphaerales bacterium]